MSIGMILVLAALAGVAALDPAEETTMVAAGPAGRAAVPFQYAWRFHYGDDPSSPPGSGPGTAVFEQDLANYSVCEGMEHAPNRFSLKDCRIACSYDPNCLVWQAFPIEHGRLCYQGYVGMNITCTAPDREAPSFMGGGRRAAPPSPAFRTVRECSAPALRCRCSSREVTTHPALLRAGLPVRDG